MKTRYVLYVLVLVISFTGAWLLPVTETFKTLSAIPGIGALFLFLNQLWREDIAHERVKQLKEVEQDFVLGTASHMAEVAYDKHVAFCEEYISRVEAGRQELFRDGPSKNSMDIGRELVNIRQKHAAWLTPEIEKSLQPFEQALIRIGAREHVLEHVEAGESRARMIDEIYSSFGLVLGHQEPLDEDEANLKIDKVIEKIREILGIPILTKLRQHAASIALQRLTDS